MKKTSLSILFIITSLIILTQSGVLESLMLFLLVGAVPGTAYSISPNGMLLVVIATVWLIVFRFAFSELANIRTQKRTIKKHIERKKRMPVRRFSEI